MEQKQNQENKKLKRRYRQIVMGVVVSDKMNKTRVIAVERTQRHPLYHKNIKKVTRLFIHDEKNESKVGDWVSAALTRPLSAKKHFKLLKIEKRGGV